MQNIPSLLLARARITHAVRTFFAQAQFVEVDTPILLRAPAPERFIEAPAVQLEGAPDVAAEQRFLQTSPELGMKQVMAKGLPRIFQIAPAFRQGDFSPTHRPEFRLLEWYRAQRDWQAGMDDCRRLLVAAGQAAQACLPPSHALPPWLRALLGGAPIRRVRMDEAFLQHAGICLREAADVPRLREALSRAQIHHDASDGYDELCHRALISRVEPALLRDAAPLLLTHFPAAMASWAPLCADDPLFAERFELYAANMELANGFTELVDGPALAQRFAIEHNERRARGKATYAHASAFFDCLPRLPACMGVAMGFDRLLMAVLNARHIDAVQFLSFDHV